MVTVFLKFSAIPQWRRQQPVCECEARHGSGVKHRLRSALGLLLLCSSPPSLAELKAMDEFSMSDVAGQAGITMEFEGQLDIGEIEYTDEGSLAIQTISIGGAGRDDLFEEGYQAANGGTPFILNVTDKFDDVKLDIDIDADGELNLKFFPTSFAAPVDFRITTEAWQLRDADGNPGAVLVDNFSMDAIFTQVWASIGHDDTLGADRLNLKMKIGIDDLDMDLPFLGLGIRDFRMTGADYDTNPNLLSANADIEANIYNGFRADGGSALAVDLVSMDADIRVGAIELGGTSIGSVTLDDLSVRGGSLRIYGH